MWIRDDSTPIERALTEFAALVEIVSHTPNTKRDAAWWSKVREMVCQKHGVPSLRVNQPKDFQSKKGDLFLHPRSALALEMAAWGYTVPAAAKELGVTVNTVKTHRHRAMKSLGTHTIAQAVAVAIRNGLIRGGRDEASGNMDWVAQYSGGTPDAGGHDADGERD